MVYELWNHAHFDCQFISFSGIYDTPYNLFKFFSKIGILWQKNHKNWQILVSFWWQYSACYPQTVLLVRVIWSPKKNLLQRKHHYLCSVFFFLGKDDSFYLNLLRITWFMEKISLPRKWTLIWQSVIYHSTQLDKLYNLNLTCILVNYPFYGLLRKVL